MANKTLVEAGEIVKEVIPLELMMPIQPLPQYRVSHIVIHNLEP